MRFVFFGSRNCHPALASEASECRDLLSTHQGAGFGGWYRRSRHSLSLVRDDIRAFVLAALLLGASTLHAQESVYIPTTAKDSLRLYAFTDTNSVRIDLTVPRAAELRGATARGKIFSVADESLLWSGDIGSVTVDAQG